MICDEANLLSCSKLLQKVEILSGDFEQTIQYANKDTVFYLYTDGYVDQNCYKTNKRIGTKNFLTMLLHIRNLPLKKQKQILEDYLSICLTNQSQRDDITILAVKL